MIVDYVEAIIEESKKDPIIVGRNDVPIEIPQPQKPKNKTASQLEEEKRRISDKLTAIRSAESKKKAQIYVLLLIENTVTEHKLQQMVKNISTAQYEDVCLERCLSGVCGFPLCSQPYQDSYGTRDYVIRSNTVYNIDRRRNFCSNVCFEASQIVRGQISSTPLYLRTNDYESQINIKMPDISTLRGLHGEAVDISMPGGLENKSKKQKKNMKDAEDVACVVQDFAVAGLLSTGDNADDDGDIAEQGLNLCRSEFDQDEDSRDITDPNNEEMTDMSKVNLKSSGKSKSTNRKKEKKSSFKAKNRSKSVISPNKNGVKLGSNIIEKASIKKSIKFSEEEDKLRCWTVVQQVEKCLTSWLGWESLVLVMGERYVRELLNHHGLTHTGPLTDSHTAGEGGSGTQSSQITSRYVALCAKVRQQELFEELEANKETIPRPAKEVPQMDQIMDDFESMSIKVKSYYKGGEPAKVPDSDPAVNEMADELQSMTVDNSQVAIWRREIACEKLDPHLPEVIECLGLNVDRIRPLLTNLVSSLNLQEDLHLRALQWQLLTLLLLKLLSVRYPVVHAAFNDPKIVTRELLPRLAIFQLDVGYLDRILAHLTQADAILKAFYDCGPPQTDQVTSLDLD